MGGGGKTSVSQSSTTETNVDVDVNVENAVDLRGVGEALQQFGTNVTGLVEQLGNDTKTILQALITGSEEERKLKKAEVLIALNGQKLQEDQANARVEAFNKLGRVAVMAGGAYWLYRIFKKG